MTTPTNAHAGAVVVGVDGSPHGEHAVRSQQHELLVIGRRAGWWSRRLAWGALTTAIAEHAHSTVLVVP